MMDLLGISYKTKTEDDLDVNVDQDDGEVDFGGLQDLKVMNKLVEDLKEQQHTFEIQFGDKT